MSCDLHVIIPGDYPFRFATSDAIGKLGKTLIVPLMSLRTVETAKTTVSQSIERWSSDPANDSTLILCPTPVKGISVISPRAWLNEHLRHLTLSLNALIIGLKVECDPSTCPQLRGAHRHLYQCSGLHSVPKSCSAIDYSSHTLDGLAILIMRQRAVLSGSNHVDNDLQDQQFLVSLVPWLTRLYHVFEHAYYHHKEVFLLLEAEKALYARFRAYCEGFKLLDLSNFAPIPI